MEVKIMEKKFCKRDFFYNNGIVNLYQNLKKSDIEIEVNLTRDFMQFSVNEEKKDDIYDQLLEHFVVDNKLVHKTDNDRAYWSVERKEFVADKKFDIKQKGSTNDIRYVYDQIKLEEVGMTAQQWYEKFLQFKASNEAIAKKEEKNFIEKGKLKADDKISFIRSMPLEKAYQNLKTYLYKEEPINYNSAIQPFEDGPEQKYFRDLLKKGKNIDKWDAMIYWYGTRIQLFYNGDYYIFPDSNDLIALSKFKEHLKIDDEIHFYIDEKSQEKKKTTSNIPFDKKIGPYGINALYYYISDSEEDFLIKLLTYIYAVYDEIETRATNPRRVQKKMKELFADISKINFQMYAKDGDMKSDLKTYTKGHKILQLFDKMNENEVFKDFLRLIQDMRSAKDHSSKGKDINANYKKYTHNILNSKPCSKNYYLASYIIYRNKDGEKTRVKNLPQKLYDIEQIYLEHIGRDDMMQIHSKSKTIGDQLGSFLAKTDNKNMLFLLRNVKNHSQFVSFFKQLQFESLKSGDQSKYLSQLIGKLEEIFEDLESNPKNWEMYRDYIAIYAINKYKSVNYAQSKKEEK